MHARRWYRQAWARRALVSLALAMGLCAAPAAQPGQWQAQDLQFDYRGFTTHYSCDGLADRLRLVLSLLGARADLQVTSQACSALPGHPDLFPSLRLQFSTLHPATAPGAVAGHWKSVNLGGMQALAPGECELAEEIVATVLPRFSVRNLGRRPVCVPHESAASLSVPLEVFVADGEASGGGAQKR